MSLGMKNAKLWLSVETLPTLGNWCPSCVDFATSCNHPLNSCRAGRKDPPDKSFSASQKVTCALRNNREIISAGWKLAMGMGT